MSDTIAALATPYGRSGIGVVRLSGQDSLNITRKLVRDENFAPAPRFASFKKLYNLETSDVLDEAIITYFQFPHSFTGEDVVEISCHGSPVILRQILDFSFKLNARMAEPGEFSLRALSNGRINLSQAEAIRDLIDAQSAASAKLSIRQLKGELSNQLQPIKDCLLEVIVILESSLEFVEDDLPDYQFENIKNNLLAIQCKLEKMASTFQSGRLLREGLKVVLAGRPNVGKSSLFNSLLGQERAIVTEFAGTTRDQLNEKLVINGIPITLIDTAGLRETSDKIEIIGVERSKRIIFDADLVIVLIDGSQKITSEDTEIVNQVKDINTLIAINKLDLEQVENISLINFPTVKISAKTGEGLELLQNAITEPFLSQNLEDAGFLITDARHNDLLLRSLSEIKNSCDFLENRMSEEIILVGLHNALKFLGKITGEVTTDDMLTQIFSTFCIGK